MKKKRVYIVTATHNGTAFKRTGTWEFKSTDVVKAIKTISEIMQEANAHWPPGTYWESKEKKG